MRHWLIKSEPDVFGIDDLAKVVREPWSGVRNYQARNFMWKDMRVGDGVLFYHSSCPEPGVAGLAGDAASDAWVSASSIATITSACRSRANESLRNVDRGHGRAHVVRESLWPSSPAAPGRAA